MRNHRRERGSQDFVDVHHTYWPRRLYRGSVETRFRNLACHKVRINRRDHNDIHALEAPPAKPSIGEMLAVLLAHKEGRCQSCLNQKPQSQAISASGKTAKA